MGNLLIFYVGQFLKGDKQLCDRLMTDMCNSPIYNHSISHSIAFIKTNLFK